MNEINTQEEFEQFVYKTFFTVFDELNNKTIKKWDELKEMAKELVRCDALKRTFIGLDFFDASI